MTSRAALHARIGLGRLCIAILALLLCLSHGTWAEAAPHGSSARTGHAAGFDLPPADHHHACNPADDGQDDPDDLPQPPGHLHLNCSQTPAAPEIASPAPFEAVAPLTRRFLPLGSRAPTPPVQPPSA